MFTFAITCYGVSQCLDLSVQLGRMFSSLTLCLYVVNYFSRKMMTMTIEHDRHLQIAGAVMRLRQSISVFEIGGHLEWVDLGVRLLSQGEQFPDCNAERPLHTTTPTQLSRFLAACKLLQVGRIDEI